MQNFNGCCCCKDVDLFAAATCGGKISLKLTPVDAEVHKSTLLLTAAATTPALVINERERERARVRERGLRT
jgi:hypothetical protein